MSGRDKRRLGIESHAGPTPLANAHLSRRHASERDPDMTDSIATRTATTSNAGNGLGILTSPISVDGTHQQQRQTSHTNDSAVFDRMLELESVIATVKSSLDNHASSYYSVASQIAELNARIGRMNVAKEPQHRYQPDQNDSSASSRRIASTSSGSVLSVSGASNASLPIDLDSMELPKTAVESEAAGCKDESNDDQYTRIQEMIDSLIKDADSALNSKPGHHRQRAVIPQVQLDDSTDLPSSCDPFCSPEQLSSVSTVFEEVPTIQERPGSSRRSAAKHYGLGGYRQGDSIPQRPSSAMSTSSRSRRRRPQTPVIMSRSYLRADPSEADAESDTGLEPVSASIRSRVRSNSRSQSRSSYTRHELQQNRYHETGNYQHHPHTQQQQQQQQQQQYSYRTFGRHRSDTLDSFLSNSSETCVSPGNRISREFYRTPMSHMYAGSDALVDSLCTPTRRNFDFGFADESPSLPGVHRDLHEHSHSGMPLSSEQRSEFPRLYTDDQLDRHHGRSQSPFPDLHAGSPISGSNVTLIRRFRNSVSRAALRTASFVDDSVNDDIAALAATSSCRSPLRPRSSTATGDRPAHPSSAMVSPRPGPSHVSVSTSSRRSVEPTENGYTGSPLASREYRNGNDQPESLATLWMRRQNQPSVTDLQEPALRIDTASIRSCPVRGPDIIEECESSSSKECSPLDTSSEDQSMIVASPASPADAANMTGLFGMVSLLYWTLLFTLGALMLDSFLCQVAGKRVMGTVDKISQSDDAQEKDRTKKGGASTKPSEASPRADGRNDDINVANTVGRFVRWYIDGPDDRADGNANIANHKTRGDKARTKPALGLSSNELNTPRTRKPSAMRGSFKHIG